MIVPKSRSWLGAMVTLRGSVLPGVFARVSLTTIVAFVVAELHELYGWFDHGITPVPFSLVGLALGVFLGFRNNTSYDRFWEGRKLWGKLVNDARTFARQAVVMIGPPAVEGREQKSPDPADDIEVRRRDTVLRVVAFVHALRHRLRDEDDLDDVAPHLPEPDAKALLDEHNRPIAILHRLGEQLRDAYDAGFVHPQHLPVLEDTLVDLTNIQGGCERIKATPIPFSYNILLHRIVGGYCFALPFGLVGTVGLSTPLVVLLVSYAFFGLDAIGDEIENPFGYDANDLPLGAISRMIERDLRKRLGDDPLPPPLEPVDGVLT